tara:strand:+ start:1554 stop:1715 length:162 start_codon:yes stop_codon:yes gene_type:complete
LISGGRGYGQHGYGDGTGYGHYGNGNFHGDGYGYGGYYVNIEDHKDAEYVIEG